MSTPTVNDVVTSALQAWAQGNQQGAIDGVRPHAEDGQRESVLLLAWFLSQMGQPTWPEAITWARRAAELGMPQVAAALFASLVNDPNYRAQAPDLARDAVASGWSIDPLPYAPNVLQQNDPSTAVRLVEVAAIPRPYPASWEALLQEARTNFETISAAAADIDERQRTSSESISSNQRAIQVQREEVEKRAHSLIDLIDNITNAQATSYFEEEATTYGGEARWLWRGGLAVVGAAALVALAPLVIYYYQRAKGHTPWLAGNELVAAHTAFVIALGAVAGVLLARARGRDRARQRNRDLSVALQTMFVYAEQIGDEEQRQTFIREMGRTVLEAFLRQEPRADADRSLLAAIRSH